MVAKSYSKHQARVYQILMPILLFFWHIFVMCDVVLASSFQWSFPLSFFFRHADHDQIVMIILGWCPLWQIHISNGMLFQWFKFWSDINSSDLPDHYNFGVPNGIVSHIELYILILELSRTVKYRSVQVNTVEILNLFLL